MRKKINILFILLALFIPVVANAASIDIGSAKNEDGKATWSVIYKGDKLSTGDVFNLNAYSNDNGMVTCSVSMTSPVSSTGAVASDTEVPSSGLTIGTLKCETTSTENQKGSIGVKGTLKTATGTIDLNMNPKTYTVNAARQKSSDSKLKSLTSSQGTISPGFSDKTFDYTVYNIKDTINSIRINYTCDHCDTSIKLEDANVSANKNSSGYELKNIPKGNCEVSLTVVSEDGKNNDTYKITIIKGETEYDSAKVTNITIGDSKFNQDFKEDVYEGYTVTVPYDVKDISKVATIVLKDPEAKYEFKNGDNLQVGSNEVELVVTSVLEDNTQTYKITVIRLNSENIKLISYKNGEIKFTDADKNEQTLSEEEFEKQYPTVWKDIKDGKYKFDENGNLIEDKTEKKSNKKTLIIILVLVIGIIVIGISGYFIFRKKDPEKEKEKIKKKAMKKARKDELKKLEEEYYKEYYGEDFEDEETEDESDLEESEENDDTEEVEEDKPSRSQKKKEESLLEDDYIFEQSLIEDENESDEDSDSKKKEEVVDVDTALEDLMNTKTYDFSDEFEDIDK